ncbi:DUF4410 domain-containing protein [Congregibacter brevis]|uniref:DUF4410 domain-containing protein n=1 Tax=Congregibacter brevis TaxID=3081201 RepID=A0ABZ0IHM4_9GAMM|nr:DUF4410 domain-containing protein [Congregibacter sp. IMCC45268]
MRLLSTKSAALTCGLFILSGGAVAEEKLSHGAAVFSKDTAIHVHLFDTSRADLGKSKHADIARSMANSAPHLLAADIVNALREAGFTKVTLDESESGAVDDALQLTGRFTKLDPGSQNLRVWIGFGAGKSEVCISGKLSTPEGNEVAEFDDCKSGLGWGQSGPQGDKGAEVLGDRVAGRIIGLSD